MFKKLLQLKEKQIIEIHPTFTIQENFFFQ